MNVLRKLGPHSKTVNEMCLRDLLTTIGGPVSMLVAVAAAIAFGLGVSPAVAAGAGAAWAVNAVGQPTNMQYNDNEICEGLKAIAGHHPCDRYVVTIMNSGSKSANGEREPIKIVDILPAALENNAAVAGVFGEDLAQGNQFPCTSAVSYITCEYGGDVPPGDILKIYVYTLVRHAYAGAKVGAIYDSATVEGGGAPSAHTGEAGQPETAPSTLNEGPPGFGIQDFSFDVYGANGLQDEQASDHPTQVTVGFDLTSRFAFQPIGNDFYQPIREPKDIEVYLPLGLIGNPQALSECPESDLGAQGGSTAKNGCPASSRIGNVTLNLGGAYHSSVTAGGTTSAIYNMVPEHGYPAEFGFDYLGKEVLIFASVVRVAGQYMLRVGVPGALRLTEVTAPDKVEGAVMTFFGYPNRENAAEDPEKPFFTDPPSCAGGELPARLEVTAWEEPSQPAVEASTTAYPEMTGCGAVSFGSSIELAPTRATDGSIDAGQPSGFVFSLSLEEALATSAVARSELRDAEVVLPEGVSLSPAAAAGLTGCTPDQIDLDVAEIGSDGLLHVAKGRCAPSSRVATVEVTTPVLPEPLTGNVYLAQPQCGDPGEATCTDADATNGKLFSVYLEAEDAAAGVVVKLPGELSADPTTGHLTARFDETPQLPFSNLQMKVRGGPRAPLANPPTCGTFTTTSDLMPWSAPETPDATPSSSFAIDEGCGAHGFAPMFVSGTTNNQAGAYSPLTLTFSRNDGEQDFKGLEETLPPGLLAKLAGVPWCGEAEANAGLCSEASRIGTVTVGAGPGPDPYYVTGKVYLTGPYNGGPFGEVVVVPAVAGPFNLGDVVVRGSIRVNPNTAQATIVSDPFPSILDGIPLQVKTVNVTVDRPGFTFNPTNCDALAVNATITSTEGASAGVSSRFQAANCANLPFKPSFVVSTQGKTSKANGASLGVRVGSGTGQANIAKVRVTLPKQLPARLTTLQKACTEAQFDTNPAGCPAQSDIGSATAITPLLAHPLSGPAYLVSHGGAAFPDVVFVLQGEGILLYLDGNTNVKKGITTSTFNSVPDAPISTFETTFPEGPHSVLATNIPAKAKGSMCGQSLTMPTTITGQNGAVTTQTTHIAVTGCPKAKKKAKAKAKAKHKRHGGKGKGKKK